MLQKQVDRMAGEAERYKQAIAKMEVESSQLRDRLESLFIYVVIRNYLQERNAA